MAVAEISKLNLAVMSYDRDAVLNALQRTNSVEVKMYSEAEDTSVLSVDCEQLRAYLARTEEALLRMSSSVSSYIKSNKIKTDLPADGFEVAYTEFVSAKQNREQIDELVEKIYSLSESEKQYRRELASIQRSIQNAEIYSKVDYPLKVTGTQNTKFMLGTVPSAVWEGLQKELNVTELAEYALLSENAESKLIFIAVHKSASGALESILQNFGFANCQFDCDCTGSEYYADLRERENQINGLLRENEEKTYSLKDSLRGLKIYCDYLAFELEKAELAEKMRSTQTTVLIEAYVPKFAEEAVKQAIEGVSSAVYYEFSKPADDETPPTLLNNNKVVKNFEAVTNMYSPVSYREFDPNAIMAFFYSLFLGFIMGDIGYGLIMLVIGGFVYFRSTRDTGLKRLAGVFAIGGIFAVVWGFLFNSLFGITMDFMPTVMPNAQKDMWLLMGIKIPAVLIISLLIGIVQLFAGYLCKALQCFRRKEIVDGILDGVVWALFTAGVALALVGLVDVFNATVLAYAGGIMAGATLVIEILTAGRKEKLLGKFTKGFGAAYGVINFASDVLSYARLYGLMLSGAVIAQIVSQYSAGFITGGNPGLIILGVVLMLVGHVFNLAIGLLGAYIHDARLQYVEFYGRFYEGEGELFTPLGSQHKYIYLNN